jgi:hypothetical protein
MSHNLCAHADCGQELVVDGVVVGEVCHIKGEKPTAARYDEDQADEERHAYENLIGMCRKHHRIIDSDEDAYPAERLLDMKREHEESDARRYVIKDELVQRIGDLLAADAERNARQIFPDWTIRELFFHIRPDLVDNHVGQGEEKSWESVAKEVMDHFSTGRLKVWGRPILKPRRRAPLKLVDEPGYWTHARFTYWFLKEDGRRNSHTAAAPETGLFDYADLQVNREEALKIWPEPGAVQDDGPEIQLLEAARRAYSQTRNDPAASFAEMGGASDKQILTWYCTWIAQRMPMFGARRPSTKIEPVTLEDPAKDFHIESNTLTLRERHGNVVWENLRVKFDKLPAVIADLKATGRE